MNHMRIRKQSRNVTAVVLFVSLLISSTAEAKYSGGSGTADDPYRIASARDLIDLGNTPVDYDKHFILAADIDMNEQVFGDALIAAGAEFWGDQADGTKFTGDFNGNGHRIMNLTIDSTGTGSNYVGLFGYVYFGARIRNLGIENGQIRADGGHTGALVGRNHGGTIERCYTNCRVTSTGSIMGGIVGTSWYGTIRDCYASGSVRGGNTVGGVVGRCLADIRTCYSTARLSGSSGVGGVVGDATSSGISLCFWDREASGITTSDGGFSKTTAQMKQAATFVGWDSAWMIDEGRDAPRLAWEQAGGTSLANVPVRSYAGTGTVSDPFVLSYPADLMALCARPEDWSRNTYFELANDIDMAGAAGFLPVGHFEGVLKGNGYAISNLVLDYGTETSFVGLIGSTIGGFILDLRMESPTITGANCCGALTGVNRGGLIANCASESGSVAGRTYVGGLVGRNTSGSTIRSSFNGSHVRGSTYVGGVVGFAQEALTDCYNKGSVGASVDYAGGIGGYIQSDVTNCYNRGSIECPGPHTGSLVGRYAAGTMSGCFWDIQVGGQAVGYVQDMHSYPDPGTVVNSEGRTTARMKDRANYISAGWDFEGETINGTADIWTMSTVDGYPVLFWQEETIGAVGLEDFETGSFMTLGWEVSGQRPWVVASGGGHSGEFCARSGSIGAGQHSSVSVTVDCAPGEVSFWQRVSCHSTMAGLEFYIDGERMDTWSGREEWRQVFFPIASGIHTFTWTYFKSGWSSVGEDTAWIDDIQWTVAELGHSSDEEPGQDGLIAH